MYIFLFKVAFNKRGKIQYLKNNFYQDHGCSENESVLAFTMGVISNCYDMSSWDIKAYSVVTDTPSNTFCRAPGLFFIICELFYLNIN